MLRRSPRSIDPERLLNAADTLLEAMRSPDGLNTLIVVQLEAAPGSTATPGVFTPWELKEAMALLLRLGLCENGPTTTERTNTRRQGPTGR